jgi:hypothetical protein
MRKLSIVDKGAIKKMKSKLSFADNRMDTTRFSFVAVGFLKQKLRRNFAGERLQQSDHSAFAFPLSRQMPLGAWYSDEHRLSSTWNCVSFQAAHLNLKRHCEIYLQDLGQQGRHKVALVLCVALVPCAGEPLQ